MNDKDKEKLIEYLNQEYIYGLGVDQGYANLGCSILKYSIKEDIFIIEKFKTIKTPSSNDMNKRLLKIYNSIKEIILDYPNSINIAGCERLFHNNPMTTKNNFGRNKSASIMKTNMATGVVYLLTAELNIPINDYAPTTVKKKVTGNGRANKDDVNLAVTNIALNQNIEFKTEHEADSVAIGITAIKGYIEEILEEIKEKK